MKPVLKEDQHEEGHSVVVMTDPNNESSLTVLNKGKARIFEMDKVFHPQSTQEEVIKMTRVKEVLLYSGKTANLYFGFLRSSRRLNLL